ncbi:DUF309 domain-containing protein [Actinoplanes sp. L3-i22]|uniref:DUF309 domain-containing protein n=1 Tax=Actinoplanes sp. L3-i22 TaxID=2836373 RepID=UPI001C765D90|nr:DUF309 domain-containing protein [Actinoplanes sp. L3-i22]BCY08330.1 hypothetical protein L3i22_034180 [Actinoplanes sp. L3-i22]
MNQGPSNHDFGTASADAPEGHEVPAPQPGEASRQLGEVSRQPGEAGRGFTGAPAVEVVRDRDAAGRARNARPRDGLGRPLPHGMTGIPTTPEDLVLPPAEALREAEHLLAAGRPFHAHEVLEGAWKACDDDTRELWKGLAQLAVGVTHLRRGNEVGAVRLLSRAGDRISAYAEISPHGIPVAALTTWTRDLAARIGHGPIPEEMLAPRLRSSE